MFITEMELLQARLAAGKRLNDSHILKEILQEDRSSEGTNNLLDLVDLYLSLIHI